MTSPTDQNAPTNGEYVEDADLEASFNETETESAEDVFAAMDAMVDAYRRAVA